MNTFIALPGPVACLCPGAVGEEMRNDVSCAARVAEVAARAADDALVSRNF